MKTFKNKKRAAWLMAAVMMGTFTFAGMAMQTTYAAVPTKTLVHDSQMKNATIQDLDNDTRVFAVDKTIEVKKVTFQNRYGFDVAGHLYLPKDFDDKKQYKAVVVTGPFGAVKEQSSGLYAQEMAKNGFVAVAFDPSTTGGKQRQAPQYGLAGDLHGRLQRGSRFRQQPQVRQPAADRCYWHLWSLGHGHHGSNE